MKKLKSKRLHIKLTEAEYKLILGLASQYTSGNVSAYIRMRALNILFESRNK